MQRLSALPTAGALLAVIFCAGCPATKPPEAKPPVAAEPAATEPAASEAPAKPAEPAKGTETKTESAATPAAAVPSTPARDEISEDVLKLVAPLTKDQVREGWINLFDGTTLFGWTSNREDINWSVVDGTISADSGSNGLLLTSVPFADYELHCEFNAAEGANSGVFLRTLFDPKDVKADCYELNIADTQPEGYVTGSFVGRKQTAEPIKGSGGWKTFDVVVEGNRFDVKLDGKEVISYLDEAPTIRRSGLIGLQKNSGKIQFRNVRLKPLNLQPLMNGVDLSGWRAVPPPAKPKSVAEFKWQEDAVHVTGGPGFLETEKPYGDFVFQIDAATHARDLNSGFFFRAEPGSPTAQSNGYEVQVNNMMQEGDRTKPDKTQQGTGAIFRRATARVVASDDFQWATITLVASGPQFATWVNGYPVVNWKDERPADPNPRKGLRLEPGHLSLQGHDPTTDVSFRKARIGNLP
ncbi:hypothetical protein Pan44_15920 [Caulifigura coniformis]|uniref:3-keto-alpha-glucoside-1,2-lyase/3-keto-2-hydroxy-glucal hydratase domain-containing protein n=1 Tax=Caulifigura coniformis TaxID=2527983 RepID=A0A517SBQ3_9PLAN|nr:DUF1080 domain-containing protein [Caulifigura coniformis]QDT53570.1 hypothetical protein Pan44_15920 [Caulifigura coniformis]